MFIEILVIKYYKFANQKYSSNNNVCLEINLAYMISPNVPFSFVEMFLYYVQWKQ